MKPEIPQGPWHNPSIEAGVYAATIKFLRSGCYGSNEDHYIQIVLWLPQVEQHLVTNLYFPRGKADAKTVQRLGRLCQVIGLAPQDALDNPQYFNGCELKVKVTAFKNGDREYRDVELFLHADSDKA